MLRIFDRKETITITITITKTKSILLVLLDFQKILDASPSMGSSFYLDAVVNIDLAIRNAQTRMWKALRSGPEFNISTKGTEKILNQFSKFKVTFVILHIDIVGSTQLSMTLPLDRLTTIIQTFCQEMSIMIELYGGHVLKYIGDAVLAFFVTNLAKIDYVYVKKGMPRYFFFISAL